MKSVKKTFTEETTKKGIFILSFSENRDDLNQWRGYANKVPAYCIEFDLNKMIDSEKPDKIETDIDEIANQIKASWSWHDFERKRLQFLLPCIYSDNGQRDLIDEIVKDSIKFLKYLNKHVIETTLGKEIAKRLVVYAPLIKHKMSASEREWRIIIIYEKSCSPSFTKEKLEEELEETEDLSEQERLENAINLYDDNVAGLSEDKNLCGFRMGKSLIVPYFKFKLDKDVFKKIIIGACSDKKSVKESTLYFLSQNGFSYEEAKNMIEISSNPYRNW